MESLNLDFSALGEQLVELLVNPGSNLLAALVLYGIITLILLIGVVAAIMFLMNAPDDEEEAPSAFTADDFYVPGEDDKPERGSVAGAGEPIAAPTAAAPRAPRPRGRSFGIVLVAVAAAWLVAGFTTSEPAVCTGCHVETVHSAVDETIVDPHENTSCVSCHEPGGRIGRYVTDVPGRLTHFIDGIGGTTLTGEYGRMTQSACRACHSEADSGIVVDEERGLRMSHKEPVEAKMRCLDCHTPVSGVVAAHNAGMNSCLRCHDSVVASAECTTCHDRGAAAAARARTTAFSKQQITAVTCGGCHDEKTQCDPCHGVRMPHSPQFMVYNHARAGAVDVWDNDGQGCQKCHTESRRPCTRCHQQWPGNGHASDLGTTHANSDETHCNSCHQKMAITNARSFCVDVCHTPSAMEGSPR